METALTVLLWIIAIGLGLYLLFWTTMLVLGLTIAKGASKNNRR
jgi:hypothetical protein